MKSPYGVELEGGDDRPECGVVKEGDYSNPVEEGVGGEYCEGIFG